MNCDQCGVECKHRLVTLTLELGRKRTFCSDGCESKWMRAEVVRRGRYLNKIYINSRRGYARDIARAALLTNQEP